MNDDQPILSNLKALSRLRNIFFVVLIVDYLLGFVTWSIGSWINNTGFVSVINERYIIAGIVPTAILYSCLVVSRAGEIGKVAQAFFYFVSPAAAGFIIFQSWTRYSDVKRSEAAAAYFSRPEFWSSLIIVVFFVAVGYFYWRSLRNLDARSKERALPKVIPIFSTGLLCIAAYIAFVHPRMRAEFGGGAARCADVEVDFEGFSSGTLDELGYAGKRQGSGSKVRIDNFAIFYTTAEAIVGEYSKRRGEKGFARMLLEIPRKSVKLISWKQEICEKNSYLRID